MWVIIEDKRIRHRWECTECNGHVYVEPWFYSEMGKPVCEKCDRELEYIHTEIEIEK